MGEPDFSGWATKAGLKCSDGVTIMHGAFQHMDKVQVPLVWQHGHNSQDNVLGHAMLEAYDEGVRANAFFNDTPQGQNAKKLVQHGDIKSLSIYANQLAKKGDNVVHGMIREVSLVLAGANPGAVIDYVSLSHGDGNFTELDDEAIIHTGEDFDVDVEEEETEAEEDDEEEIEHADGGQDVTVQDIYDGMTEEEQNVVHYLIGAALEQATGGQSVQQSQQTNEGDLAHQEGADSNMSRNVFDQSGAGKKAEEKQYELSHEDVKGIVANAIKIGSLKDAVEGYALAHGITNIDLMFPDAKLIADKPELNKRRTEWVADVLSGTRHTPFSRVKTIVADITQEEARAKGYIKGNYKLEEWFGVTKRTTTPTTIYKKQKLDRDDMLDITDFDVVAFLKEEMRIMLDEEFARAVLIGDGRTVGAQDKIKDPVGASDGAGIRSIANDHELFVTTLYANVADANSNYEEVVDVVMDGMEYYKGSGTPTFYTTIRRLNMFKKAKDANGQRYYKTNEEVAQALGVGKIVTVEPMNEVSDLIGIIVNLSDYNVGTDKGGEVGYFDFFDIDYNQQKYLMETRASGALVKVKAALVIRETAAANVLVKPTTPTFDKTTGVVTIPTQTGVVYKNSDTSATLTAGAQTALALGATLNVQAVPATNYYFQDNASDFWSFKRPSA
jgi:HK97 family phage prohead protease